MSTGLGSSGGGLYGSMAVFAHEARTSPAKAGETRALGEKLREALSNLARRQDEVEQFLHGKDKGEVFAVPGNQRTSAKTPRQQEETAKRPTSDSRRKGNGSTGRRPAPPDALSGPLAAACRSVPRAPGIFSPEQRAASPAGTPAAPCYATGFRLRRDRCSSPFSTKRRASSAWPSTPCSTRYARSEGSNALTVTSFTSPYGVEK